jgi:hypothetical protein
MILFWFINLNLSIGDLSRTRGELDFSFPIQRQLKFQTTRINQPQSAYQMNNSILIILFFICTIQASRNKDQNVAAVNAGPATELQNMFAENRLPPPIYNEEPEAPPPAYERWARRTASIVAPITRNTLSRIF